MSTNTLPVTYLGDADRAAAFTLAGIRARTPAAGEEESALAQARDESQLVLLGARFAMSLPPNALENALASLAPLVAIIHDGEGLAAMSDPVARARRQLGLD
jgi:vacuolar-type H+-ATPase subunit F/Vma7